jgi:hypothetical protein
LFIYTRTPQQNARTIWGRYFPGFTEHEQRLHSEAAFRDAVRRAGGLTVVATQTFRHPRSSTAGRLRAQAEGRHYSTFSLYTPEELRASIATFLARLPGPEVCWVDEHLLVVVGRKPSQPAGAWRPGQPGEPGDQGSGPPDQRRARRPGSHKASWRPPGDQLRTGGKRLQARQHHLQRKPGRRRNTTSPGPDVGRSRQRLSRRQRRTDSGRKTATSTSGHTVAPSAAG